MPLANKTAPLVALLLAGACVASALADDDHDSDHRRHKKHDGYYVGRTGVAWQHDYEITSGRCNRDSIGAVVGGVVGGTIANRVGEENRAVATVIGVVAGAAIGHKIGAELDERDRDCVGHALEIGRGGRVVVWTNERTGVRYQVTPGGDRRRDGVVCREYTLVALAHGEQSVSRGLACSSQPGRWHDDEHHEHHGENDQGENEQ